MFLKNIRRWPSIPNGQAIPGLAVNPSAWDKDCHLRKTVDSVFLPIITLCISQRIPDIPILSRTQCSSRSLSQRRGPGASKRSGSEILRHDYCQSWNGQHREEIIDWFLDCDHCKSQSLLRADVNSVRTAPRLRLTSNEASLVIWRSSWKQSKPILLSSVSNRELQPRWAGLHWSQVEPWPPMV